MKISLKKQQQIILINLFDRLVRKGHKVHREITGNMKCSTVKSLNTAVQQTNVHLNRKASFTLITHI